MIKKEELEGLKIAEVQEKLQADLEVWKEELSNIKDQSELEKLESDLMPMMDELDAYLNSVEYELPDSVEYNGESFTRADVYKNIQYFLNKLEVEYSHTLGLYQMVNIWRSTPKTVNYGVYDSTLRCLGQAKFKGYTEWHDILVINEYMTSCHERYSHDTAWMGYLYQRHNLIVNRMGMLKPLEPVEA